MYEVVIRGLDSLLLGQAVVLSKTYKEETMMISNMYYYFYR